MFEIGKRYMLRTTNKLSAKTTCEKIVILVRIAVITTT